MTGVSCCSGQWSWQWRPLGCARLSFLRPGTGGAGLRSGRDPVSYRLCRPLSARTLLLVYPEMKAVSPRPRQSVGRWDGGLPRPRSSVFVFLCKQLSWVTNLVNVRRPERPPRPLSEPSLGAGSDGKDARGVAWECTATSAGSGTGPFCSCAVAQPCTAPWSS